MSKTRYVLAGTGGRGIGMFGRAIVDRYAEQTELVGLCDINPIRMKQANKDLSTDAPAFTDFAECLKQVSPDRVIVTTKDSTHHEFIVAAMENGCDVITEKPMTIGDAQCRAILRTERETGRTCRVAFNYRHAPYNTAIKEMLASGRIGKVISVDFHWYLNTRHGADYYRRWHRRKENSGGLLVHKATHHFDLLNWWLDQDPSVVFARGDRQFYGPTREERGERCSTCDYTKSCEFHVDYKSNERMNALYFQAESADGYFRDQCVFDPEIDIEDNMQALIGYSKGTNLAYTLNSFQPLEGYAAAFNGTEGRLEAELREQHPLGPVDPRGDRHLLRLFPRKGGAEVIHVPVARGGHGGGDARLLDMLFLDNVPDPLGHSAGTHAGAMSILTGVAANQSIASGQAVTIESLLDGETGR